MAKKRQINRFNDPGPFMQRSDLTPEQIKRVELQNRAFKEALNGDNTLGVELGLFPKSALKKNKKQKTSN